MTPEELEDDTARPLAPDYPGLSRAGRLHGRRLALIHDMYRQELAAVATVLARLRAGGGDPAALAAAVGELQLTRNLERFGSVCGQQCALLQNHHDIEEQWMFPALAQRAEPALQRVIDRLIAEHKVIHALIGDLRRAATALAAGRAAAFEDCARCFEALDRAIRSHFGYEETQLQDALGAHQVPI